MSGTTVPEGAADDFGWSIFVVHHDERAMSTVRRTLGRSQAATFARGGGSFGDDLPPDARLSRRHARFLVDGTGALYVVDEGSRNGVHRMGERVAHAALVAGDVLRIGGFLFVVQPTPLRFDASDDPRLPLPGAATATLVRALRAHARSESQHVILLGEAGCSVEAAARAWADAAGLPLAADAAPGPGALCIQGAHQCPEERLQRALASGRRVIFDATGAPSGWSPPPPLAHLPSVPLSPLRARREDLLAALTTRWRSTGADVTLTGAHAMALLLAPWPGNEAQLHRVADALAAGLPDGDLAALLALHAQPALADDEGIALVAPDGSRFRTTAGELVDLRQRPVLARILHALAAADGPRSVDDLIAAAWPGANLVGESGSARVYAAVATLRRFGLRDALVREGEGYRLDPRLARVDPAVHSIS